MKLKTQLSYIIIRFILHYFSEMYTFSIGSIADPSVFIVLFFTYHDFFPNLKKNFFNITRCLNTVSDSSWSPEVNELETRGTL